jgi:hypothetical protein
VNRELSLTSATVCDLERAASLVCRNVLWGINPGQKIAIWIQLTHKAAVAVHYHKPRVRNPISTKLQT